MTTPVPVAECVGAAPCVSCGASVAWDPGRQQLVCRSCGSVTPVTDAGGGVEHFPLLPRLADRPGSGRDWPPRATHLRCRSCQSVVAGEGHVVGRVCEACGTPALVSSDGSGAPVLPSGVLPFRLTEADAWARLAEWLKSGHVLGTVVDTVRGLYLPCWVFNARVSCRYRGERQRRSRRGGSRRIPIDGIVELNFEDYLIPATGAIDAELVASIGPFTVADMRGYDTRYLAGFISEPCTRNLRDAWDAASARMEAELNAALRDDSKCAPSALETWPEWRDHRGALVLVPAYVITYRHEKHTYRGVVNGSSGRVTAARPRVADDIIVLAIRLAVLAAIVYGIVWLLR